VLAAHVCRFGGLVDILDPKRIGYLDAFDGLPNVRIHTEIDGMIAAIDEFRAEMENRYRLIEARQAKEGDFQPRVLLDDEKGSLTVAIRQWWKADGGKGEAPPLTSQRVILWQGRAAQMYVFTFCQQANLNVIPDSDMRDQYGFRIASGPQSLSSWRMMFSGPKLRITKRKGRAHVAVGADDPTPVQLARITPQEARDLAAAGVSHPAVAARRPADRPAAVPGPARPALAPAERPALRLVAGAAVAELDGGHRAGDQVDDLVVGLAAAAELLGMNVEAFRKARRRRPIEGETRAAGQPAFPPSELRAWQSRRKIAGRRSES
jgi:hypothetical protein